MEGSMCSPATVSAPYSVSITGLPGVTKDTFNNASINYNVTPSPSPVCEIVVKLLLDDLGVAGVTVPGVVAIEGDNVEVLTRVVL